MPLRRPSTWYRPLVSMRILGHDFRMSFDLRRFMVVHGEFRDMFAIDGRAGVNVIRISCS